MATLSVETMQGHPQATAAGAGSSGGGGEERLFCLEVVVDKCSEKGTEQLMNRYKPKNKNKGVNIRGVKDMDDLKKRLKSYLKEAQNNECQLPKESEYSSRACAVRFLDYPLLIVDRARVTSKPVLSSHPLRGVEVNVPFGQGKSCMFHSNTRKLVRVLKEHPLHFVYLDLRKKSEPKLVGTASIPISDSLILEHKGLHTHTPIYSITGEHLGVLSVYVRLSCHGSTLLRHLVNFRGISSTTELLKTPKATTRARRVEGEETGSARREITTNEENEKEEEEEEEKPTKVTPLRKAERVQAKVVADLSALQSFKDNRAKMYGQFKPPSLFYDPELEVEQRMESDAPQTPSTPPALPVEERQLREDIASVTKSIENSTFKVSEEESQEDEEGEVVPEQKPKPKSMDSKRNPRGRAAAAHSMKREGLGGAKKKKKSADPYRGKPGLRSKGNKDTVKERSPKSLSSGDDKAIQANFASMDTHEIIRELALEISNAIKSGTGALVSQIALKKSDAHVVETREGVPELDLEIVQSDKEERVNLLASNSVEDELEQLLQDLEQRPITSIIYGEEAEALRESVEREVESPQKERHAESPMAEQEERKEATLNEGLSVVAKQVSKEKLPMPPPEDRAVSEEREHRDTTGIDQEEKEEEKEGEEEAVRAPESESEAPTSSGQQQLILSDPSEEKKDDESTEEESYTPIEDESEDFEVESTYYHLGDNVPITPEADIAKNLSVPESRDFAPPPPPTNPSPRSPQYKDGIQESMKENSAMAAVDKLWEAEYGDVPTDLDSILNEEEGLLSGEEKSITDVDSYVAEEVEEEISEDILSVEDSPLTTLSDMKVGEETKRSMTLFATRRTK